jgi:putative phosphoesterase
MKIGLISDIHATLQPLREALAIFESEGVEMILCAGDVAGYGKQLEQTVQALIDSRCRVVMGNHDLWCLERSGIDLDGVSAVYLRNLPAVIEFKAAGRIIYMVHASPPDSFMDGIKLLDENAALIKQEKHSWSCCLRDFHCDVLVVGHTHQVFAEQLGNPLVINPGSTLFNHTCAILTLPEMAVQIVPLSHKDPVLSWNWGLEAAAWARAKPVSNAKARRRKV